MSSSAVAVDCSLEAAPAPQTRPTRVFLYPHDTSLASNYGQQEVDAFNQLFASDAPKTDKVVQGSDGNYADKSSMTRLWLASDVYVGSFLVPVPFSMCIILCIESVMKFCAKIP